MDSLLLNVNTWDLTLDGLNNIATTSGAYALAQNVASAVRLFLGEQIYQINNGIPYFNIFGKTVPRSYLEGLITNQALTVPGVITARTVIDNFSNRKITGRVLFTDSQGEENGISF